MPDHAYELKCILRQMKCCIQRTDLLEVKAMRDIVSSHECSQQVGYGTSLTAVRPEHECVHAPLSGEQKNRNDTTESSRHTQTRVKYILTVNV